MTSSLTNNLVRHLSISREGEIEDLTAQSTMTVLGMPPELRVSGDCTVLLYAVDSRSSNLPMYLAASLAGYTPPTMALIRRSYNGMHPERIKYYSPFHKGNEYKYVSPLKAPAYTVTTSHLRECVLSRYLSGAFIVGGEGKSAYKDRVGGYMHSNKQTLVSAKRWARTYVSPRRGLCALASTTLAVVLGDESCLEACGLGGSGLIEIATTAGLHEAYSEYDFEKIKVEDDVMANVRLDPKKVNKAAKPGGLMVEYMKCTSLKEAAFNVPYLLQAYWNQNLVAAQAMQKMAVLSAWEVRRQLNLFSLTYSWDCNIGSGKSGSDSPYMRRGCRIPQYILDRMPDKPLQVEGSVEVYQRTLKERKRNLGITYRTSGAKKASEREYLKFLENEVLTLRSLEVDYRLWRASLDSLTGTGTVPEEWQDPSTHSGYKHYAAAEDSPAANGIVEMYSQVNYCERQGMLSHALPIYYRIMFLVSMNIDGVPYPAAFNGIGSKDSLKFPMGLGNGNHTHRVITPYDSVEPGKRYRGCEELLYPWVGLRMEEIAVELGIELSDEMQSTLHEAKTGCLVPEGNPFYEYFKILALEDCLY